MLKYDNTVSSTVDGKPIYGAQVTIFTADEPSNPQAATIYSDEDGTIPLSQPILTDQLGYFAFYIRDGKYDIRVMTGAVEISRTNITMVDTLSLKQRALLVPVNEASGTLPAAGERAGKLLGFDSEGAPSMAVPNSFVGPPGPPGTIENNNGFTAGGPTKIRGNAQAIFAITNADDSNVFTVDNVFPRASIAGTRTSAAPRVALGNGADPGFDVGLVIANTVRGGDAGAPLFRDTIQTVENFQGLNGANAAFDAFNEFTGSFAMNHQRDYQARGKTSMTGGALLAERTLFFAQPIFNGTFDIGQIAAFWVRDAQKDSGTQNLYTSYGILVDNCPNWGQNFVPICIFDESPSYIAGTIQLGPNADIYGGREFRSRSVHGTGGVNSFEAGGGVAMYAPGGGPGILRSYANDAGGARTLAVNPAGGRVVVGDLGGVNGDALLDVAGITQSSSFYVGANQVVGARGAAVADATDAASVITQFNALLSRLRAHGLIAA